MKRWLACLILGVYVAIGAVAWAQPQVPPTPTTGSFYAQDYAGVLSQETKARIDNLGSQLKAKTKAQIVVVTVKTLEGNPISDYARTIMRQWGVGDKTLNNGVVMLIVADAAQPSPRYRIEVGYGLEGRLNDAKAGRIIDDYMLPYFQQGDYDKGVLNGYLAIATEVAKEYNLELRTDAKPAQRSSRQVNSHSTWDSMPWWLHIALIAGLLLLFVIDWLFFGGTFTFLLLALFRGGGGGGGYGGGGGGGGSGGGGGAER